MKNKKRKFEWFSFYDHTGIKRHLEKMAAKGWMIEKIGRYFWHYRRIEPKELQFDVSYLEKNLVWNSQAPLEEQDEYLQFCEQAGWHFVASWAMMHIFCHEGENAVLIETDAVVQVKHAHEMMRKHYLRLSWIVLGFFLFYLGIMGWLFYSRPTAVLTNYILLCFSIACLVMILDSGSDVLGYYRWHKKAKRFAEEEGGLLATRRRYWLRIASEVSVLCLLIVGLCSSQDIRISLYIVGKIAIYLAIIAVVDKLREFTKREQMDERESQGSLMIIAFVLYGLYFGLVPDADEVIPPLNSKTVEYSRWEFTVYLDDLPLNVEDLVEVSAGDYSRKLDKRETFLMSYLGADQQSYPNQDLPELEYEVLTSEIPVLFQLARSEYIEKYRNRLISQETSIWEAEEAYRIQWNGELQNHYLIVWENQVLDIVFDWEPTPEQIEIVVEKLNDY